MVKFTNIEVYIPRAAIRGMRNPLESWEKSDSLIVEHEFEEWPHGSVTTVDEIGPNDLDLMKRLEAGGPSHRKYMRMMKVWVDINAPLYWWKEFDTYTAGVVKNSCSTMHKIHAHEFTMDDFSREHLFDTCFEEVVPFPYYDFGTMATSTNALSLIISVLNQCRKKYLETKDKKYWWQMIQLLPSSYNQTRTVELNYEAIHKMWDERVKVPHRLDEWREQFAEWVRSLPYSELITKE